MSGAALVHAFAHAPRLRNPFSAGTVPDQVLLVELSSGAEPACGPSLQDLLVEAVEKLASSAEASVLDAYFDDGRQFWAIRHALSEGLRAAGPVVGLDLSFTRSQVMSFRRAAISGLAELFPEFEVCDFGHVADGGLHFNLLVRNPNLPPARLSEVRRWVLARAVRDFGGSYSGEHGLGPVVQDAYDRFASDQSKALADRIQAALGVRPAARVRFGEQSVVPGGRS